MAECYGTLFIVVKHICRFAYVSFCARISYASGIYDIAFPVFEGEFNGIKPIDSAACAGEEDFRNMRMTDKQQLFGSG